MKNTTVMVEQDGKEIEVYLTQMDALTDEFVRDLEPEELKKPSTFMGLLKYLYVNMFRPDRKMRHNSNSTLVEADAETISDLWDAFSALCFRYGQAPTILKFSQLTGIDRATFTTWKEGTWRTANQAYSRTAKKMFQESEAALEAKAIENNSIGAIFGLKCNFLWRETAPIVPEIDNTQMTETAQQISARYAEALRMPDKPDLTELDALVTGGEHDDH